MTSYVIVAPIPPVPSVGLLTYGVPEHLAERAQPGVRALVPLARRTVTAVVIGPAEGPPRGVVCRDVTAVLDEEPLIGSKLFELLHWMADYYLASLPEVLSLAIGRGLTTSSKRLVEVIAPELARTSMERHIVAHIEKAGHPIETAKLARLVSGGSFYSALGQLLAHGAVRVQEHIPAPAIRARQERIVEIASVPDSLGLEALLGRARKRRRIYEYVLQQPDMRIAVPELARLFPHPTDQIKALENAGLVRVVARETYRKVATAPDPFSDVELSNSQISAVESIVSALGSFAPFLLHGVTASGKTEVYVNTIRKVVDQGGSAIVLVPEISLTHQLVSRLVGRFGPIVAVLHSELRAGERWDEWRRVRRGEATIVVGARSAIFAPAEDLGIIIVDEEHDGAYKQGEGPRYHGRDVAIMRGRIAGCPVVLGSATPSIESWYNAMERHDHRYVRLQLPERVTTHPLPAIEVVDLRGRDIAATGGLSEHLARLLGRNLEGGGQSLLFINRRGYAASLQCYECGGIVECSACSVGLTLHRNEKRLRCHHCNAIRNIPDRCPECRCDALVGQGLGTERLEAAVRSLLPEARVARLDRDTAARKGRSGEILADWRAGRIDILIGTQMITKGHDIAGVNLVGVVLADLSLGVPDFRAAERTFQLLSQVAGRAGRGSRRGRVIVQTYRPDHFAIAAAVRHDYEGFARAELTERAELGYPPCARMVLLRMEGRERERVIDLARAAAHAVGRLSSEGLEIVMRGPAPAPIERLKGRYRYQLQLRAPTSRAVRHAAARCKALLAEHARRSHVRLIIDVDPVDVL